ncbi:MAG: tRNA (adenosine(37)-N6)-dimethylallyltransferase MiaA [Patescibacteria group bacterium]|nr:tRNA (adenosine(37)-N6)-dimethylallyltransferase MiaA [Patescibacteria group bacterium]
MSIGKKNNHRIGGTGKIIVVLGPTASGKTTLGVSLARKFNGEIISADSRQVYKGMDIGTGKDLQDYRLEIPNSKFQIPNKIQNPCLAGRQAKSKTINIPYHLIDVVNPNTKFSLAKYQRLAFKAIDDILRRSKTPIIVGGSGLYLQAVVDNYNLSGTKPDKKLREKLEKESVEDLFLELKNINPKFAERLNGSERKNKRRLIRYLEIMQGEEVRPLARDRASKSSYDFLLLGLTWPREVLKERIYKRLVERLEKENMVGEVEKLHKDGVSWKRLESFGLEYKYISLYLQGKLTYEEIAEKLNRAIGQFAKRQMTWFRRWEKQGRKINWVTDGKEAERLVKKFLK